MIKNEYNIKYLKLCKLTIMKLCDKIFTVN